MGFTVNRRAGRLLALVLLSIPMLLVPSGAAPAQEQEQAGALPTELAALQSDQVELSLLATAAASWESGGSAALHLSRIADPGDRSEQVVNGVGPELWYVESGAAIVEQFGGTTMRLEAGESIVVDGAAGASVRFDGRPCPSVLRLEVASSAEPRQPQAPVTRTGRMGVVCQPAGTLLLTGDLPAPAMPSDIFISWLQLDGLATTPPATFSGPVGVSVEQGAIGLGSQPGGVSLGPGSWASFEAGQSVTLVNHDAEPSSGWLVGLLQSSEADTASPPTAPEPTPAPTATAEPTAPPASPTPATATGTTYISPLYGWTVTYDPSLWYVGSEVSDGGYDSLSLWNQLSRLTFSSGRHTMNALECLDFVFDTVMTEGSVTNVQPATGDDGQPIRSGDETRASSVLTYEYLNADTPGRQGQFTQYTECFSIVPGEVILIITHVTNSVLYEIEAPLVRDVIGTLTVP